jgi:Ni,Fe-hydrogenase III small subunit/NAD-dependent dihydropyrimidine dehydrogenase PreA subunit
MLNLLKLRKKHGYQAIPDLKNAELMETHRGFPIIDEQRFRGDWQEVVDVCPTGAIAKNPVSIDLGKCIFCGECERASGSAIKFTNKHKLGTSSRERLVVSTGSTYDKYVGEAIEARREIHRLFGRSLKLRQVSAGGCNGCEMELTACGNVNFDMGRFGIDFVASPRHADGIVITGPITKNMAPALMDAYKSISEPKVVIAVGACAISGGVFEESVQLNRKFFDDIKIDLYVPGCPPHPLTFINAVLKFIGRK